MKTKLRIDFKSKNDMNGWVNISGCSHIESNEDVFVKPIKWGLFEWNKENEYPANKAASIHDVEIMDVNLVCRPISFL